MRATRYAFPILLSICLLTGMTGTASAQDSLLTSDSNANTADVDHLSMLLDLSSNNQESVWQWLQSVPTGTQFRGRIVKPDTENYPAHYARLTLDRDNLMLGMLAQRDLGERNMLDLWRASVWARYDRSRIVVGDFQVDEDLGWTIAGTPTWSATTDAYAILRRPSDGIRMNLSTEEGWGWKGAAVATAFDLPGSTREFARIDMWAGLQEYDSYQASESAPLYPYSTQGDHSEGRSTDIVQLPARHAGGHIALNLPDQFGNVGATVVATQFLEDVSPQVSNSRFRFADNHFSAAGFSWHANTPDDDLELHSEFTMQSTGAQGGGFAVGSRIFSKTYCVASGWRATQGFATFHSRPTMAFGSDPAGVTGGQIALVHVFRRITVSSGIAVDWTEPEPGELNAAQRQSLFIRTQTGSFSRLRTDASVRLRRDVDDTRDAANTLTARLYLAHQVDSWLAGIRFTGSFEEDGAGSGLTLSAQRQFSPWLVIHTAISGVAQVDAGSRVTLVESHGPGEFPFRSVSSEQISASARLDLLPIAGIRIWIRAGIARTMEPASPSDDPTDTLISLGLDWSDFL